MTKQLFTFFYDLEGDSTYRCAITLAHGDAGTMELSNKNEVTCVCDSWMKTASLIRVEGIDKSKDRCNARAPDRLQHVLVSPVVRSKKSRTHCKYTTVGVAFKININKPVFVCQSNGVRLRETQGCELPWIRQTCIQQSLTDKLRPARKRLACFRNEGSQCWESKKEHILSNYLGLFVSYQLD